MRLLAFVVIPATVGLAVLARPIVGVLFERGAFDATMTVKTAQALQCYALALLFVAPSRLLAQGFYALQDAKTPVRAAVGALLVNAAASFALMGPMLHAGLALATAISSAFYLFYLLARFRAARGSHPLTGSLADLLRICAAAAVMGGVLQVALTFLGPVAHGEAGQTGRIVFVTCAVVGGVLLYEACCLVLGLPEAHQALRRFRRRR
jgi:putative peptidoglycan lipid II flippase